MYGVTTFLTVLACSFGEDENAQALALSQKNMTRLEKRLDAFETRLTALEEAPKSTEPAPLDSFVKESTELRSSNIKKEPTYRPTKPKDYKEDGKVIITAPDEKVCKKFSGRKGQQQSFNITSTSEDFEGVGPALLVRSSDPFTFNGIKVGGELSACRDGSLGRAYCGLFDFDAMYRETGGAPVARIVPTINNQVYLFSSLRSKGR